MHETANYIIWIIYNCVTVSILMLIDCKINGCWLVKIQVDTDYALWYIW